MRQPCHGRDWTTGNSRSNATPGTLEAATRQATSPRLAESLEASS